MPWLFVKPRHFGDTLPALCKGVEERAVSLLLRCMAMVVAAAGFAQLHKAEHADAKGQCHEHNAIGGTHGHFAAPHFVLVLQPLCFLFSGFLNMYCVHATMTLPSPQRLKNEYAKVRNPNSEGRSFEFLTRGERVRRHTCDPWCRHACAATLPKSAAHSRCQIPHAVRQRGNLAQRKQLRRFRGGGVPPKYGEPVAGARTSPLL